MQRFGYFLGVVHRTEHRHGPLAAQANREFDAEDPGQQTHPGEPMRGDIEQLLVEGGPGDGWQLELGSGDKQAVSRSTRSSSALAGTTGLR